MPTLFLRPAELKRRAEREKWPDEKMRAYLSRVEHLRQMAKHYSSSQFGPEREMDRIASLLCVSGTI